MGIVKRRGKVRGNWSSCQQRRKSDLCAWIIENNKRHHGNKRVMTRVERIQFQEPKIQAEIMTPNNDKPSHIFLTSNSKSE
jgi:hypothetical protein